MKYGFGYLFDKSFLNNGKLYVVNKKAPRAGRYTPIDIASQLKGAITKRSRDGVNDSLFISFWPIVKEAATYTTNKAVVNSTNNNDDFVFVINTSYWDTHRVLKIPYRTWQITATSLPFRVLAFRKAGNLESDFLNANVAYVKVFGTTKVYQSEFIETRNTSIAVGPYLGLSSIDNTLANRKEFGLNGGINAIYALQSFNITGAVGLQQGFREGTNELQPYFGFGIGFKLVEVFAPEIKEKE